MSKKSVSKITEELADELFKFHNITSRPGNDEHITDVDLIIQDDIKVDVQYSKIFKDLYDIRVDFVSIDYDHNQHERLTNTTDIFLLYEEKFSKKVYKKGKHFLENYIDYLIVFLYDNPLDTELYEDLKPILHQPDIIPNHTFIIKSEYLVHYITTNIEWALENIKINDKSKYKLADSHGSAFIPIPIEKLRDSYESLYVKNVDFTSEQLKSYLI